MPHHNVHHDDVDLFHGRHMETQSAEPSGHEHIDPLSEKARVILNSDELFKKALAVRNKMMLMHKYVRARCWLERRVAQTDRSPFGTPWGGVLTAGTGGDSFSG